MESLTHSIGWFEIPVEDFARAKSFYSSIYNYEMPEMDMQGVKMGILLYDAENFGVGGAICQGNSYVPTTQGVRLYLNGGSDLSLILNRVEGAGGKVLMQKTQIGPESGFFAVFMDTEGNVLSLFSPS